MLIRDPHPTIYSWYYTATERWGAKVTDRVAWLRDAYAQYRIFYDAALAVQEKNPGRTFLVRFEELKKTRQCCNAWFAFMGCNRSFRSHSSIGGPTSNG